MANAYADYSIYREVVAQLMQGSEQLPSLPSITLDIRRALARPDISFNALSKQLAKDPSLSAMLLKYASSPLYCQPQNHQQQALHSLLDVVRLLGLKQVERVTMLHSVQSLFTLHSALHKRLFVDAWHRMVLKASISTFIAQHMAPKLADEVLLASLLSEIGTLGVLSAFKNREETPPVEVYVSLGREYSKSLGIIMLKKWQVNEEFIQVIRRSGDWYAGLSEPLGLVDLVNLGLYHALRVRRAGADLPPLPKLASFQKMHSPFNGLSEQGGLTLVMQHLPEIRALAQSLFKVQA